jgi:hypothetical protein
VFLATPVELAVMIGWWSNAAGNNNLMNWTAKTGPYTRMWTLPSKGVSVLRCECGGLTG